MFDVLELEAHTSPLFFRARFSSFDRPRPIGGALATPGQRPGGVSGPTVRSVV
jgi:hypothetical protein